MDEKYFDEVPFLSNVGLMLTYKCTISCPHCIVKAGPHRKEEMHIESVYKWLDEIKKYRNGLVLGISLTGGEPFYNLQQLIKTANYANKLGFIVSVVTNAFWASSKEKALDVLTKLSSVQMISVSTDISHLKFIPFSNIRNALWAAKKTKKLYNIAVTTENEDSEEHKTLTDNILEITDSEFINISYVIPVGRAENKLNDNTYQYTSEPPAAACSMASFPIIFPNGKVSACIGPPITLPDYNPLYLGNLNNESVSDIFNRAEENYILHAIRTFGPKVLIELLKENGYENLLPKKYIKDATCDVCNKLFSDYKICNILEDLIKNNELFKRKTEYGRLYYLNESNMMKTKVS